MLEFNINGLYLKNIFLQMVKIDIGSSENQHEYNIRAKKISN